MIFSIVLALDCCYKVRRENISRIWNKDLIHVFDIKSILSCGGLQGLEKHMGLGEKEFLCMWLETRM